MGLDRFAKGQAGSRATPTTHSAPPGVTGGAPHGVTRRPPQGALPRHPRRLPEPRICHGRFSLPSHRRHRTLKRVGHIVPMAPKRMTRDVAKKLSLAEQHEWFQQQRSRRAVLKGGIVGAGTMIGGTALFGPASSATAAVLGGATRPVPKPGPTLVSSFWPSNSSGVVPFGRHISYGADPTRQMNIAWQVASPVANPFIRIGPNPFELGEQIPADLKVVSTPWADITGAIDSVPPAATAAKATEEQYYAHVAAGSLAPGTTYYYSVGHQGLDPSFADLSQGPIASFTTAPLWPGPFTFTAFGDQGTTYDAVSTTNLLLAQNPAFHLHAGDVSYAEDGGDGLITDSYDPRAWDSYFVQAASTAAFIPWMVSLGNHEMEPWYSPNGYGADINRFDFPGNGPAVCPGTYTFTYGNVGFISLDPNDVSYEIPANLGYSGGAPDDVVGPDAEQPAGEQGHRLHRGVLPPLRLLHVHLARIGRRRAAVLGTPLRPVRRGPRHQRAQPYL